MKFFVFIIMAVIVTGCDIMCPDLTDAEKSHFPTPQSILAQEITKKLFLQLKQEDNLYAAECGWSGDPKIRGLHCGFLRPKETNIEEARLLLLKVQSLFLEEINSDRRIYSHLTNFPFTPENIEIRIFVQQLNGVGFGPYKLSVVSILNGVLYYKIDGLDMKKLITIHTETYEEALEKVNNSI